MGLPFSETYAAANKGSFDSEGNTGDAGCSYPAGRSTYCLLASCGGDGVGTAWNHEAIAAQGAGVGLKFDWWYKQACDQNSAGYYSEALRAWNTANSAGFHVKSERIPTNRHLRIGTTGTDNIATSSGTYTLTSWTNLTLWVLLGTGTAGKMRLEAGGVLVVENTAMNTLPNGSIDMFRFMASGGSASTYLDGYHDDISVTLETYSGWIQNSSGSGAISGVGAAAGTGAKGARGAGAISVVGAGAGTGKKSASASGAITGAGAVAGTGKKGARGAGAISVVGAAAGTGAKSARGSGAITGAGAVACTGKKGARSAGAIAGVGAAVVAGKKSARGAGAIAGVGAAVVAGKKSARGAASMSGIGALAGTGSGLHPSLPKGYLRIIREAFVASARADAGIIAAFAKGQIYDWSKTSRDPETLSKSDCPALIIASSRLPRRGATNVDEDVTVVLDVTIVSDSRDAGDVEDLFVVVADWIIAASPSFGLTGAASPHTVEIATAEFAPFDAKIRERGIEWKCETGIEATIRRAA